MKYAIYDDTLLRRPPGATLAEVELYVASRGWGPFPDGGDIRYSSIAAWVEAREIDEAEAGKYVVDLMEKGFNPDQPRVPAGSSGGGQFAGGGAGGAVADPKQAKREAKARIMADTAGVTHAAALRSIADAEIDGQDKLFNRPPGTFDAPIGQLENIRARPEGIENAAKLMYAGVIGHPDAKPRAPISVQETGDGKYRIFDGNSTYAILREAGWSTAPVRLVDDAGNPIIK